MKIPRTPYNDAGPLQVIPLLNGAFLLLLLFSGTMLYGQMEKVFSITLPSVEAMPEHQREQGEIYVNLTADGGITINNRVLDLAGLQEVLNRVAAYFPGGAVIVRGDSKAALGRALEVLSCCRKAGIQDVSFAISAAGADEQSAATEQPAPKPAAQPK